MSDDQENGHPGTRFNFTLQAPVDTFIEFPDHAAVGFRLSEVSSYADLEDEENHIGLILRMKNGEEIFIPGVTIEDFRGAQGTIHQRLEQMASRQALKTPMGPHGIVLPKA